MTRPAICISATGLHTPRQSISNEELVVSYNAYAEAENARNATAIAAGEREPLPASSAEFIVKASGIRSRFVVDKAGVLDITRMRPRIRPRSEDEPSVMVEMALEACHQALEAAGRRPEEVDCVLVACSNLQRPYPAIAVELQAALGARGFAFDLNVACASAAFGMQAAADQLRAGHAKVALVVNPEICSAHLNFRNRDCHFIFGDAATATVLERLDDTHAEAPWELLSTKLSTHFSNNIRNDFGFLAPAEDPPRRWDELLFRQEGRKVFKEVVPMVSELITSELAAAGVAPAQLQRLWLHQANLGMNELIARKVLGREASREEAPVILDRYANTSSAGSVIAFHLYRDDLATGDHGLLCAFGAGYSAGCVLMRRV